MKLHIVLAFVTALAVQSAHAESPLTAQTLGTACMVICEMVNENSAPMSDLDKGDHCIGYLKGLVSTASWFNRDASRGIPLGQCPQKLLANRTARGLSEDELMIQSCKFGQWMVSRPNLYSTPAALAALNWMQLTGCQ